MRRSVPSASCPLLLAIGLSLVTGCSRRPKDDSPETIKAYVATVAPAARQSLDLMKALTQQTLAMAPLTADATYSGPPVSADYEDAAVLSVGFGTPNNVPSTLIPIPDRWGSVENAIGGRTESYSKVAEAKLDFDALAAIKYVFILRTVHREDPTITSSGPHGTFRPGSIAAEAHLFALDASKRYLGGFRFHATNAESLAVTAAREQVHSKASQLAMEDLGQQTRTAFMNAVKHFGGGRVTTM